jgi:hypothetical protein
LSFLRVVAGCLFGCELGVGDADGADGLFWGFAVGGGYGVVQEFGEGVVYYRGGFCFSAVVPGWAGCACDA